MNFKEIIELNKQNVKNIIKKITNEENEDLEQEVYLKVFKNSRKYEEQGNFKAWINTIARNVSFDYLKSARFKKETLVTEDGECIFSNVKDKKPTPELRLITNERQKRILKEIENLKPKFREVIIYTEFYGFSYEDCAEKLKCPTGTVKSRIYNAKKELAERLKDLL
ncbi:MAG: sigma-70 family RNA polymerase sigma factor [bacterium]|nr:sigma-70 family RNA polymerase sigma factor [bacterium]